MAKNCSFEGLEIFWWCWNSFLTGQVSSLLIFYMFTENLKKKMAKCCRLRARVCFGFCEYIEEPMNLKLSASGGQFLFLFMLRMYEAKKFKKRMFYENANTWTKVFTFSSGRCESSLTWRARVGEVFNNHFLLSFQRLITIRRK